MNRDVLKTMAEAYGTPLYAYDSRCIESQYRLLQQSLPSQFEIFYSLKCNPLLGICQLFKKLGSGIEVASLGELNVAIEAGFDPSSIIFTSPGKTYRELEYAIDQGIYSINIESVQEAILINEIGEKLHKKVSISIRVNPNFNISGAGMKMTGVPTQFGIDQSELKEAMEVISRLSFVKVIGIHVFTGTQMLDIGNLVATMEEIMKLAIELSDTYLFKLEFLDLGGGFGIPYFRGEMPIEMNRFSTMLSQIWDKYKQRLRHTRVGVESGRFLLAEAGLFMTKVLYVKESKGSKYAVCDGGSNHHASTAFLGRYVRNNFPMYLLGKEDGELEEVTVVGSLCTPTDVLGQKVMLPKVEQGDVLVINKSGAYGLTHSPVLFLSHLLPAEVMWYNDEFHVLRERGGVEDFLVKQRSLLQSEGLLR
jgi:diaminopimelate decarboxylase